MIRNNKGMTLLEIMIVMGILAGLVAVLAGTVSSRMKAAQVKQAKIQIGELSKALDMYYTDCNAYPATGEGFNALITQPSGCSNWGPEPYLKKMPKDPWGGDFVYESNGTNFTIMSYGADKKEGGSGNAADINSQDL